MSNEQFTEALESINYVMTEQLDIFAYALQDLNENMLLEMITLSNMVQATIDTTAMELQAIVENETMITIDTVSSIAHSLNLEITANYDLLSTYIQTSDDRIEQLLEAFNTKLDDLLNFDANSIMDGMNLASGNLAQQITSIINKISSGGLF
jgi:plasmid maintenance system antidote protein VapI